MTLEEILAGLEGLKDFVNDHQKPQIEHLKTAVKQLGEKPVDGVPKAVVDVPTVKEFKPLNVFKKARLVKKK